MFVTVHIVTKEIDDSKTDDYNFCLLWTVMIYYDYDT